MRVCIVNEAEPICLQTKFHYEYSLIFTIIGANSIMITNNVLVTGAAGFIGSKLVSLFKKNGYTVFGWDRTNAENIDTIDMLDETAIITTLKEIRPNIIVHCAGSADVGRSVQYPETDYTGNVTITHNLLFALHKLHMNNTRMVFLSSAGVYGNPVALPITEDMPVNPLSPYALHKVMCEDMCHYFKNNYGMDIKIARIFSAYGAGLRKQIFWDMHLKAAKTGQLEMFGTGDESRDYIHVNDVVQSLYLLATENSDFVIFNVANGEEITIRQATEYFAECAGISKDKISFNGFAREGDPINWRADNSRIKEIGYKKSVEMLVGLQDYVNWVKR